MTFFGPNDDDVGSRLPLTDAGSCHPPFRTARIVQYEFPHLSPEHRNRVLGLRKRLDAVVREVLEAGIASGDFDVADLQSTTLALQSLTVDVARWYEPGIRRTPAAIGAAYADLALRLVRR